MDIDPDYKYIEKKTQEEYNGKGWDQKISFEVSVSN